MLGRFSGTNGYASEWVSLGSAPSARVRALSASSTFSIAIDLHPSLVQQRIATSPLSCVACASSDAISLHPDLRQSLLCHSDLGRKPMVCAEPLVFKRTSSQMLQLLTFTASQNNISFIAKVVKQKKTATPTVFREWRMLSLH